MWDHYAAGGTALTCLIVSLIGWLWVYGKIDENVYVAFYLYIDFQQVEKI